MSKCTKCKKNGIVSEELTDLSSIKQHFKEHHSFDVEDFIHGGTGYINILSVGRNES